MNIEYFNHKLRLLKQSKGLKTDTPVEEFWYEISKIKNEWGKPIFENLKNFLHFFYAFHTATLLQKKHSRSPIILKLNSEIGTNLRQFIFLWWQKSLEMV